MQEILIDGYNLIRQSERLAAQERRGGLETGRNALIQTLAAYRAATGDRVTVVFDGDDGIGFVSGASRQQGIEVIFSRPPKSADDLIVKRIRRKHGKKAMLVVSSDSAIRQEARRHRIREMQAEEFEVNVRRRIMVGQAKQTARQGEKGALCPEDIAYWEKVFRTEERLFEA